ncbi:MAG: sigma 54-interacting transcriptional regulator [Proteobacteria bacterium]|nr:sigma 54-interacting transcriptional regulator [Pseudomonadota bacterium]
MPRKLNYKELEKKNIEINRIVQDLKKEKLFSETVLKSLPGIFYLYDSQGTIIRWNKNHEDLTGFDADELPQRNILEWFEGEDKQRIKQTVETVYEKGRGDIEASLIIKNGEKIPYYFTGVSMTIDDKPYMMGVGIDLTQIKKVEEALYRSEEKYRGLFENSAEGIFQITPQGQFVSTNPAAARILGYASPEDLIKSLTDIETQLYVSKGKGRAFIASIEGKKVVSGFELEFYRKDKTRIWVALYARAVYDSRGKLRLFEGIFSDITEQKEATEALKEENIRLRTGIRDRYKFAGIIGKSAPMQEVYELILRASVTTATTIIYGESGTGKEIVARAIHDQSDRRKKRFVPVNCGAIPENLLESEFFGYKKGAFTGAHTDTAGYLDVAEGGTLFLDELGEISLNLQVKLLRVIEGNGYVPVGGKEIKKSNIRIIAATNRNLQEYVRKGLIREDFYYRIHVIPIHLPPLRERKEDIPLLIEHFLTLYRDGAITDPIDGKMIEALLKYNWPGNVRELQNVLHRYLTLKKIDISGGPGQVHSKADTQETSFPADEINGFQDAMDTYERHLITRALEKTQWHREKALMQLGIPRRTFFRKIKKYGLIRQD